MCGFKFSIFIDLSMAFLSSQKANIHISGTPCKNCRQIEKNSTFCFFISFPSQNSKSTLLESRSLSPFTPKSLNSFKLCHTSILYFCCCFLWDSSHAPGNTCFGSSQHKKIKFCIYSSVVVISSQPTYEAKEIKTSILK